MKGKRQAHEKDTRRSDANYKIRTRDASNFMTSCRWSLHVVTDVREACRPTGLGHAGLGFLNLGCLETATAWATIWRTYVPRYKESGAEWGGGEGAA